MSGIMPDDIVINQKDSSVKFKTLSHSSILTKDNKATLKKYKLIVSPREEHDDLINSL